MYLNSVADMTTGGGAAPQNAGEKPRWNDLSQHPLDEGQGGYDRLPALTPDEAKEWKLAISRSGWKINLQRAAFYVVDVASNAVRGQRFQVSGQELGDALGCSSASGRRYLKQLRDKGLLRMFRSHEIHYDPQTDQYWCSATVNQLRPHFLADGAHALTESETTQVTAISERLTT